jgi:hypothetical protein
MSINNSPTVAIGSMLPFGNFENGKMFLKLDGIGDGLYVFFNGQWLMIGKITTSEPMRLEASTVAAANPKNKTAQSITFGGNF